MSKAIKYAKKAALFVGLGNAALNAIKQLNEIKENPEQKFDWKRFFIAGGKGAFAGAIGGGIIGYVADRENSLKKPVNTDAFLYSVFNKVKLNKKDTHYLKLQEKADLLISLLKYRFHEKMASEPLKMGSTVKGTALKDKCDIDIGLAFKRNSFRSTAEMFDEVLNFLENQASLHSIISVRDQKKSVEVFFRITGDEFKIDVVPYKRTSSRGKSKSGYLYVNDQGFWSDNSTYTKTDIHALNNIKLTETQKKVIIILKYWKLKNSLPLSSHLLENLVLDAYKYNRYGIPKNFTGKVIMVLRHIAENLDVAIIRSIENKNNILTNISSESKAVIIDASISAIQDYEYQTNSILDTFKK